VATHKGDQKNPSGWRDRGVRAYNKRPMRDSHIAPLSALLVVAVVSLSGCMRSGQHDTNVVFISIDTLRADHLSCYGYDRNTSPNIDLLAAEGHRFAHAYTSIPTTLPAHTAMFTSHYPSESVVRKNGDIASDLLVTLPEILQAQGYATVGFVSSLPLNPRFGLNQGFDSYEGVTGQPSRRAEDTLKSVRHWFEQRDDQRFFLFVHLFDPHSRYRAPQRFREQFSAPESAPVKFGFVRDHSILTDDAIVSAIAGYDAEISYADWAVGELLSMLEGAGVAERTLVVLVSDHGESLDELFERYDYAFDHGEFLYRHQLNVPLIIRLPGQAGKQRRSGVYDTPVSTIDVMPTILDILGIAAPENIAGRTLLPALYGETLGERPVFSERRVFKKAAREYLRGDDYSVLLGRWQLLLNGGRSNELYDIEADPGEAAIYQGGDGDDSAELHARELSRLIGSWRAQIEPLVSQARSEEDRRVLERLRSLGYTE